MDQTGSAQLQLALECVSKDLDRVQQSLSTYEQLMLKGERVTPQVKEVVVYYREQVTGLRKEMLALCSALTSVYKRVPCCGKKEEPVATPAIPAEAPVFAEPVQVPTTDYVEAVEANDPFELQDGV